MGTTPSVLMEKIVAMSTVNTKRSRISPNVQMHVSRMSGPRFLIPSGDMILIAGMRGAVVSMIEVH